MKIRRRFREDKDQDKKSKASSVQPKKLAIRA
jgi:hypothetical protein